MNLNNFENSVFFKRGQKFIRHDINSDEWSIPPSQPWFQVNVNLTNATIIDNLRNLNLGGIGKIRFDFHYLLTISDLNQEIKNMLLDQYFEVKTEVESINNLPYGSFLIIMPPNTYIGAHQHPASTKHTISYIYTIGCVEEGTYIEVNDDKYPVPPNKNRFILNMYNNPPHGCKSNTGWTFIWVSDYTQIIDVPNQVYTKFIPIN